MRLRPIPVVLLAGAAPLLAAAPATPAAAEAKAAGVKVFESLRRQDWEAIYAQAAFSQLQTAALPDRPEAFAQLVRRSIGGGRNQEMVDRMLGAMSEPTFGEPAIRGDYVALPLTCTITAEGRSRTFKGLMRLIRRKTEWKWDLTFADHVEEAMSRALAELIGQPADAPPAPATAPAPPGK